MLLEQEANAINSDIDENNENQDDYDDENAYEYDDYGKNNFNHWSKYFLLVR